MGFMILCALAAHQTLTWRPCKGTSWTTWESL